jgi:hypothetical protein
VNLSPLMLYLGTKLIRVEYPSHLNPVDLKIIINETTRTQFGSVNNGGGVDQSI